MTIGTGSPVPLARYAGRLHAVAGGTHHVASPLGAWLLLALCAPAATGASRAELTEALGAEPADATATASALLAAGHPAVGSAAAVWTRPGYGTPALSEWLTGLGAGVAAGELPDQAGLDDWARERTFGLIDRFPVRLEPATVLVLATALATRVSWSVPFDVVPAAELGDGSPWARRLDRVLRTPRGWGHEQYVARTARAGDVAVHTARAEGDLVVTSVIAAEEVPAGDVLAAAYEVAGGAADRRSLFDLPLGSGPLWTLTERAARTTAPDGREERCVAVLPAWSAASEHDLGRADLGFPAVARILADLLALPGLDYVAKQSAVARYGREGFEAAAVTAAMALMSLPQERDGVVRTALLRFAHPYAVVAVTTDSRPAGVWQGVPVFSAWVAEPENADPQNNAGPEIVEPENVVRP